MDDLIEELQQQLDEEVATPVKKRSSRPPTSRMVHDAILHIGSEEKGASVQKIKKYIYATYRVDHRKTDALVNRYIKKGVRNGNLIRCSGSRSGALGFFKIAAKKKQSTPDDKKQQDEGSDRGSQNSQSIQSEECQVEESRGKGRPVVAGCALTVVMDMIEDVTVEPLVTSQFVKPYRLHYKQNDVKKIWDLVSLHESVSVIIFNSDKKKLILVRQFRPAVYYNGIPPEDRAENTVDTRKYPGIRGLTLELCAGIVDKTKDLVEIARDEVLEECGYDAPLKNFEKVMTYRSGVGVSGDRQTMFYVEVTNDMKVTEGGGLAAEGEMIEVVELSMAELNVFMKQSEVNCPGGLLFGLMWFIQHKAPKDNTC